MAVPSILTWHVVAKIVVLLHPSDAAAGAQPRGRPRRAAGPRLHHLVPVGRQHSGAAAPSGGARAMKLTAAAIIVISLVMTGQANAQFKSGNDLHAFCNSPNNHYEEVNCFGYILGVTDAGMTDFLVTARQARLAYQRGEPVPPPTSLPKGYRKGTLEGAEWCPSDNVTAGQVVDVVKAYLRNKPAYRDRPAPSLVVSALRDAWPCTQ